MNTNLERRYSIVVAANVVSVSVTLAACSTPRVAAATTDATTPIAVTAVPVAMTDVVTAIDSGGVVQARTTAVLTARLLAPVREVRAVPGDRVRNGQTLIVLDGAELAAGARAAQAAARAAAQGGEAADAELQAAKAALALARASHERIASLQARRSATAQELDEAVAALRGAEARAAGASARALQAASTIESARAASDQARNIESFTLIAAPFDGVVTEKMVDTGNMAAPGTPLLRLEDTREFRLEVRLDESRVSQIRIGDHVPVRLGAGTVPVTGRVSEVSRAVDADARAFLVKLDLPAAPGLRSGEYGKAQFSGTPRRALTVPPSALVRRGQLTTAFVVEEGRARVRLLNVSGSEVLAGLSESELVILSPPVGLIDGRRVSVGGR